MEKNAFQLNIGNQIQKDSDVKKRLKIHHDKRIFQKNYQKFNEICEKNC